MNFALCATDTRNMRTPKRSTIFALIGVATTLAFLLFPQKATNHGFSCGKSHIAKIQIKELEGALQLFRFDTRRYPTPDEGLNALIRIPGI